MNINIDLEGYQWAMKFMDRFSSTMQRRMLMVSLRRCIAPMLRAAKEFAPKKTGNLANKIRVVGVRSAKRYQTTIGIRPIVRKSDKKAPFYGKMVHFGTQDRKTNKPVVTSIGGRILNVGTKRGRMLPNPFLERAFNSTLQEVTTGFGNALEKTVREFVTKESKIIAK